jgi:hypothetical protein
MNPSREDHENKKGGLIHHAPIQKYLRKNRVAMTPAEVYDG